MINRLVQNPHLYLWLSMPFVILIGFFTKAPLKVNVFDLFMILDSFQSSLIIAGYFGLLGLIYRSLVRMGYRFIRGLTIFHLATTIDIAFFIWLFFLWTNNAGLGLDSPRPWIGYFYLILVAIFVLGQLIFLINLILTLLRPKSDPPDTEEFE